MAGNRDVCRALGQACTTFIAATGTLNPAQAYVGWPTDPDFITIINNQGYAVSVYPLPSGDYVPHPEPTRIAEHPNAVGFTLGLVGNTFTMYGSPSGGGAPIHIGINAGQADAEYTSTTSDTPASAMAGLATAVNALDIAGVSATSGVNTLVVTGSHSLQYGITQSRARIYEVGRMIGQRIQVSLWSPTHAIRETLENAIVQNVGVGDNYAIPTLAYPSGDGTNVDAFIAGPPRWSDQSIQKKQLFLSHVIFLCDYSDTRIEQTTEITVLSAAVTTNDGTPVTYNTSEADS